LLDNFGVDPLVLRLLVAPEPANCLLSPVAMAAFLPQRRGKQLTLNQIFLGMLPFMAIQIHSDCSAVSVPSHLAVVAIAGTSNSIPVKP
jgi:TRAP-type mannitol/chloroaromatic compound transport system permease large subunit